jgi:uncharacterized protein YlxW (UPF0749 family)
VSRSRRLPATATRVALALVGGVCVADAALASTLSPAQPGFIDNVLASRAVVVSIRIATIFAAMFVVLSVLALIARRQWLTRVGPVEVEKVSDLDAEIQQLEEELAEANRTIEDLERNVAHSHQLIDQE